MSFTKQVICILAVCTALACASTEKAKIEGVSGFLGDVRGKLREGTDSEAQLIYKNPQIDLAEYDSMLLDPVRIIVSKDSSLAKMSPKDQQAIANWAQQAFYNELSKDFSVVHQPGPRTLRVKLAITDADQSEVVMDTMATVIPQIRTLTTLSTLVVGEAPFSGSLSGEAKLLDSMTGEVIRAGADRREGGGSIGGVTNSWNDVQQTLDYFAKRARYNLCRGQRRENCQMPES